MRRKRHPLSGAIYEELGDGRVRVEKDGVAGVFTATGLHIEGHLTHADPHLLLWVGGKPLPPGRNRGQRAAANREMVHD